MGFSYHNNTLSIASPFGIQGGQFTVWDFLISSGQDPAHVNNRRDVHALNVSQPSPGLTFVSGRHKTDAIADFWNDYVEPQQTTANDTPGSLNFAFIGQLVLQLSNPPIRVTLNDLIIGQGSWIANSGPYGSSTVNNWWFGGKQCEWEGTDKAKCVALGQDGNQYSLHFRRKEQDATWESDTLFLKSITN